MSPPFIHLRARSAYSLLEGAIKVPKLIDLAVRDRMPALALTDRHMLCGALEFSERAAAAGLQPIIGLTLGVAFREDVGRGGADATGKAIRPVALLAGNEAGYGNLMALSSRAFLDTDAQETPHVGEDVLGAHADGLIALTGGAGGPLGALLCAGQEGAARARLAGLARQFGDRLYVEVQRHGLAAERECEAAMVDLAYDLGLPIVATNDTYFAERDDYTAHDALLCIAQGRMMADTERPKLTPDFHFKPMQAMAELFADLPEALDNTVEIARRCAFRPVTHPPILPRYTPAGADASEGVDEAGELRRLARDGLEVRLEAHGLADGYSREDYAERLEFELGVIEGMKFPGYFLIVADFIRWAKEHDIPVGPGRGSGAGSLVAWSLTITDLDPMRFDLLFERFLNPERVSMPDFDIDFCPTGRDDVIAYVRERYGADQVAQIITFGTLQARAVVRDVARVLGVPYGQADRLSKLIPANPANPVTLKQAIESEDKLREARDEDPTIARLLDIALRLEGLYRHASTHAAGIVIGDRPLTELVPLYKDPRSPMPATQFNMKWVEPAGLVKFDFLGLKTLTIIDVAVRLMRQQGVEVDISALPLDDAATYDMLSHGDTVGVFQLESGGMRSAIMGMKPDRFTDIIALVALYRPGPMDNIPTYNDRKHGREEPDYIHPLIKPFLEETFGVIVYQEQVMQIAQELAGYSLGEADLLRRAMGKKIASEMAKQRPRFVDGALERGVDKAKAQQIFDLLAKFADYGFNKSHAAAYALVAYQTAWLKANHPVAFLAASMTVDVGNTAKLNDFRREAARIGVTVLPPSINASAADFTIDGENRIHYALTAIRNVGRQAVEHIVEARGDRAFASLADFARRISPRFVNKRALESLAAAGAFDCIEVNRARVFACAEAIMAISARSEEGRVGGQNDLFGEAREDDLPHAGLVDWLPAERLSREYEAIGSFLTGHPLDAYGPVLTRQAVTSVREFEAGAQAGTAAARIAGIVVAKQIRRTRNGGRLAVIGLSDPSGQVECVAFSEALGAWAHLTEIGTPVIANVVVDRGGDMPRYRIQDLKSLEDVAARLSHTLHIHVADAGALDSIRTRLTAKGDGEVSLFLRLDGEQEVQMRLGSRYAVTPQLAAAIKAIPGVDEAVYQ
ncbi:MAG: DNA polymerase III subunit alpha [Rhodobiaceae bacterium]|nr:DNA polymerase III subunit alpha [Rhodobiaceae bacterium]MCC0041310.1 DNA polymerase III subunit alpha [Rhodobiaceae bacterium]